MFIYFTGYVYSKEKRTMKDRASYVSLQVICITSEDPRQHFNK